MHRENWDDLRYVLAVAESGSVSGAARRLGVNHATVLRHVAAFEEMHGVEIFARSGQGYQIPPDRQAVLEALREVENAVRTVERTLQGADAQLSGTIRITSTDSFCQAILPGIVADLMAQSPELRIDLFCTNAHLDLGRLHADISVRPAIALADDLVGQRAGVLRFGVFAPAHRPVHHWLSLGGALARSAAAGWMQANLREDQVISGADSFVVLREMAAAGLGQAILPLLLGQADPRLAHLPDAMPALTVPIWVASHADFAHAPRLRLVRARLAEALLAIAPRLAGQA